MMRLNWTLGLLLFVGAFGCTESPERSDSAENHEAAIARHRQRRLVAAYQAWRSKPGVDRLIETAQLCQQVLHTIADTRAEQELDETALVSLIQQARDTWRQAKSYRIPKYLHRRYRDPATGLIVSPDSSGYHTMLRTSRGLDLFVYYPLKKDWGLDYTERLTSVLILNPRKTPTQVIAELAKRPVDTKKKVKEREFYDYLKTKKK